MDRGTKILLLPLNVDDDDDWHQSNRIGSNWHCNVGSFGLLCLVAFRFFLYRCFYNVLTRTNTRAHTHTHTHTPGLTVYPSRFRSDSQAKRSLAASILKLLSRSSSHRWCWPVRVEESWSPSLSMPFLSHSLRMPTRSLSWLPTSFTTTFRSSERSLPCRRG